MTLIVSTILVLYFATGHDVSGIGPHGAFDRTVFVWTIIIAMVLGILAEGWVAYWRFRPEGPRRAAFVLTAGLANTLSSVVLGIVAVSLLASPWLDQANSIATVALTVVWMVLGTWLLSSRLVTRSRNAFGVEWRNANASPFLAMVSATIASSVVAWSVGIAASGSARDRTLAHHPRPADVRNLYSRFPPDTLGLVEPIEVVDSGEFIGGAAGIAITLMDASGKLLCVEYVSGSYGRVGDGGIQSQTVYIRAESCDLPTARALAQGGVEESALYGILLRWEAAHPESLLALPGPESGVTSSEFSSRRRAYRVLSGLNERFL